MKYIKDLEIIFSDVRKSLSSPLADYMKSRNPVSYREKQQDILDALAEYVILLASDLYVKEAVGSEYGRIRRGKGALNTHFRDSVWAYFKPPAGLFSKARTAVKIPERGTHTRDINDQLQFFRMIDRRNLREKTNVTIAIPSPAIGFSIPGDGKVRVGLSVMTSKMETEFPLVSGTSEFTVSHTADYDEKYKDSVLHGLRTGAEEHLHILVFPEYMITEGLLRVIMEDLERMNGWNELWFVLAGTRWTPDNRNRLTVISRYGTILGVSDKIEPFQKEIKKPGGGSRIISEKLDHPGEEILFLDIPGIGRFQFPVCRDVCVCSGTFESSLADRLAGYLQPDMIIVPAWSNSVENGFANAFISFAERGAVSILCNCCEPVFLGGNVQTNPPKVLVGHPVKSNPHSNRVTGTVEMRNCKVCSAGPCREECMFVSELSLEEAVMTGGSNMISDFLHRSNP